MSDRLLFIIFFFFNDTATTEIYTLSLHDALPISSVPREQPVRQAHATCLTCLRLASILGTDRKSTRLNSSHGYISYAVFCLKKKKKQDTTHRTQSTSTHCTSEAAQVQQLWHQQSG